jgi:hypothetical protein
LIDTKEQIIAQRLRSDEEILHPFFEFISHIHNSTSIGSACRTADSSSELVYGYVYERGSDNVYQVTEAGIAYLEVKAR